MDKADLYKNASYWQKRDAFEILSRYIDNFSWSPNEMILDIGCGPGDVTNNILLPNLPESICQLVGWDISHDMINSATSTFSNPKLSFTQMDIASKTLGLKQINQLTVNENFGYDGVFNKIFSFYCLHWVSDQKLAMENIYKLLKPEGEGFVLFIANCATFDMYESMAKKPQWKSYMKDVAEHVSPYQHCSDPKKEFEQLLRDTGFKVTHCCIEKSIFPFEKTQHFTAMLQSVDPFVDRIPNHLRDTYMDESVSETLIHNKNYHNGSLLHNPAIQINHELIVAHFKKP